MLSSSSFFGDLSFPYTKNPLYKVKVVTKYINLAISDESSTE